MKVQIVVRGRTYTVRSDEPDLDLREVAAFVDARMAEVSSRATAGVDEYTVALLTCLNIASDLERHRRDTALYLDEVERELISAEVMLRSSIPDATDDGERAPNDG
jgi:cell division protein ZapA (FtsZ GTPase activity inhibitor)